MVFPFQVLVAQRVPFPSREWLRGLPSGDTRTAIKKQSPTVGEVGFAFSQSGGSHWILACFVPQFDVLVLLPTQHRSTTISIDEFNSKRSHERTIAFNATLKLSEESKKKFESKQKSKSEKMNRSLSCLVGLNHYHQKVQLLTKWDILIFPGISHFYFQWSLRNLLSQTNSTRGIKYFFFANVTTNDCIKIYFYLSHY